jgi:hypothetical protein
LHPGLGSLRRPRSRKPGHPYEATAARLPDLIDDVEVIPVEEGPHNIGWTHPEVVNPLLLAFVEGGLDAVRAARSQVAAA